MTGVPTAHGDGERFRLLSYLRMFRARNGYLPSIAELSRALSMSRTSIIWHLGMLRDEGELDYVDGNVARSLHLRPKVSR